jgi:L-aspartate oxidase
MDASAAPQSEGSPAIPVFFHDSKERRPARYRGSKPTAREGSIHFAFFHGNNQIVSFAMKESYDVIVVGSGIAGLSFALKAAQRGHQVLIITKKERAESNTNYAQGGIASVTSQTDDFEMHVKDTLEAGDGLCNEEVVREIVRNGPERIEELIGLGVGFTQLDDGRVSLHREGGHSKRRILHVKDVTGKAIEEALLKAIAEDRRITVREHFLAIDLITARKLDPSLSRKEDRLLGLYALDARGGQVMTLQARAVLLGTGGTGQIYQFTSNPEIATGDGIAIADRAGIPVANMEFIQFHPTTLYADDSKRFLISEAVRGEGGILRLPDGTAFMERFHPRKDLAPRDVVARAIDSEMKRLGADHLWLDITHLPERLLRDRFPTIHEECLKQGVDMALDWIPVVPAMHYLCGGVVTDTCARTSLAGVYACGEVACTGLHGANRLASNSLLEAVVLATAGAEAVDRYLRETTFEKHDLPDWVSGNVQDPDERVVLAHNWSELRRAMWDYVGIVRTTKRLERARARVEMLAGEINDYYWNFRVEPALIELRNMVQVSRLVIECALQRKESRGLHFTLDYPDKQADPSDSQVVRG